MAERIAGTTPLDLKNRPSTKGAQLRMLERPFKAKVGLRGGEDVIRAVEPVLGFALPRKVGETGSGSGAHAFWIGPDDWIIVYEPGREAQIVQALREACRGLHHAVIDLSERMTTICLEGQKLRDVLAAGCPLDLHPRAFRPGMVLQSHLGKANVILHYVAGNAERPFIDLYTNRSFADYVWKYLENAAREFGYEIVA
jgi:sarcosine oxidase subunit gamma